MLQCGNQWIFLPSSTNISCLVLFVIYLQNSGIDKAYLFDTLTKIYIATDSSPVDMQSYEICSDMIDVLIDIECIYG